VFCLLILVPSSRRHADTGVLSLAPLKRLALSVRIMGGGQCTCLGGLAGSSAGMAPEAEADSDAMATGGRWREREEETRTMDEVGVRDC
jgi:hypothetical protein